MTNNTIAETPPKRVSSFAERFNTDEYFTGVGHLNILSGIRRDIAARVPLIVLTGEEGCGKSVMGKMVAAEARSGCIPVYFGKTVDSFEDVVCVVAGKVDVDVPDISRAGIAAVLEQIAAGIAQRGERILLICDGAERIFLATLERIRKMMDRINRVVVSMQVVLIGRPMLLDNLRQLSVCNFEEMPEKRYVLAPLSFSETTSYLQFCKRKMPDAERGLFTPEVIDRMYQASGGNFKKIHYLAEELCNRNSKDASFWVLLENVESGGAQSVWDRQKRWLSYLDLRRYSRRTRVMAGAVVCAGLLMLVLLKPEEQQSLPAADLITKVPAVIEQVQPEAATELPVETVGRLDDSSPSVSDVQSAVVENAAIGKGKVVETPVELSSGETSVTIATDDISTSSSVSNEQAAEGGNEGVETQGQLLVAEVLDANESLLATAEEAVAAAGDVDSGVNVVAENTTQIPVFSPEHVKKFKTDQAVVVTSEGENETTNVAISDVPYIRVNGARKNKQGVPQHIQVASQQLGATAKIHELQPRLPVKGKERIAVEGESKKIPVLVQAIIPEKSIKTDGNLYQSRTAAGAPWLAGKRDNKYTIQLMALSSNTAEEQVQRILTQKDYVTAKGKLYIFEKKVQPQTIFLFFGEYSSLAEAEIARDALPDSLRKHKPYVLSVKGAMQKIQ